MMTIKEFASLCACNAQTLRYYDKINLLKPAKVDPWSGYRYYAEAQAIDFVKIKNLQTADFTIEEIKALLAMPDHEVSEAFDRKIAKQAQKLLRIKEIKQSYLTEKNKMEKLVQNVTDYLFHAVSGYEMLKEFGLPPEDGPQIMKKLKAYIESSTMRHLPAAQDICLYVNDQVIRGADHAADALESLKGNGFADTVWLGDENVQENDFSPEESETVWTCRGWKFVHEFIDDIPRMDQAHAYCFFFKLSENKPIKALEFPLFMIGAMLHKTDAGEITMGCCVEHSTDGENHFALLKKI